MSNHGNRADSNWVRDKPGVLGQCLPVSCFRARGALRSAAFELIDASVAALEGVRLFVCGGLVYK